MLSMDLRYDTETSIGKLTWGKKVPNVMEWDENDNFAYILEVDLEYPKELHDEHSDYPLAPENMNVLEEYLSDHQKGTLQALL